MAHDHATTIISHAHNHSWHAGHSHAPDNFGWAFAIGASLNTAFVTAELVFGYAANSLALISDAVHNLSDVIALLLAWGAAWLAQKQPTQRQPTAIGAPQSSRRCSSRAVAGRRRWHRRRGHQPAAGTGAGRRAGPSFWLRRRCRHQWRDCFVVHARPPWRPQYSRRLAAYVRRCWRFVRRGGRGTYDHADGMAVGRSAISLVIAAVVFVSGWGLARDSVNLALDGVPRGIELAKVMDYLAGLDGVTKRTTSHLGDEHQRDRADRASGAARRQRRRLPPQVWRT